MSEKGKRGNQHRIAAIAVLLAALLVSQSGPPRNTAIAAAVPAAPTTLVATMVDATRVDLAWTDNATDETGSRVLSAANAAFTEGLIVFTVGPNVTTYSDMSVFAGATFYYKVTAYNAMGDSAPSAVAGVSIPVAALAVLAAPSRLVATAVGAAQIDLAWTDNSQDEEGFLIERATDAAFSQGLESFPVGPNVVTYSDLTVVAGTAYNYRITALNTRGNSAASNMSNAPALNGALAGHRHFGATMDSSPRLPAEPPKLSRSAGRDVRERRDSALVAMPIPQPQAMPWLEGPGDDKGIWKLWGSWKQRTKLSLPFDGVAYISQGWNTLPSHYGRWRYALNFIILDQEGRSRRASSARVEDYYMWGAPVLAPAAGKVVALEQNIADSPAYQPNGDQPWGNYVIIDHGNGEFSEISHLRQTSIVVQVGQIVERGQVLGLVGNSGYSYEPHIHFQVQDAPYIGATTLPARFARLYDLRRDWVYQRTDWAPLEGYYVADQVPISFLH